MIEQQKRVNLYEEMYSKLKFMKENRDNRTL